MMRHHLIIYQYPHDEKFSKAPMLKVLISECLSCDPPSDPNTMPPLIQSYDGITPLPPPPVLRLRINTSRRSVCPCLSRPVFTKKRKDVSCFWQINSYITAPLCSRGGEVAISWGYLRLYCTAPIGTLECLI